MKRIIVLLVYFCVSISVFEKRADAQNSEQKTLAGTVWRSNYLKVSLNSEFEACLEFTFNSDGTFTRVSISQDMMNRKTNKNLVDYTFDKWTGTYIEEAGHRLLLIYKNKKTTETYEVGMDYSLFGEGKIKIMHAVLDPESRVFRSNLVLTKIDEVKVDIVSHDVEVGKGNIVNSENLGDISKMLCGKMWQEKIDPKKATVEIALRGYLFNSDKTFSSSRMFYNPNAKKVSYYRSKHGGTFRVENGLLYLKNSENKVTNFTLVSITDSLLVLSENNVICEFVILNSKDDNVTQKFTIPYIKEMIAENCKLDSLLEEVSKPYRTVKGKSYVNVIANPKSGTETLQFYADGTMFQRFQLPPADGFPKKDGRYIETPESLTTIISKPPTDDYITTEYKLNWINSNQFELTKKNSKDKPIKFVVINQKPGK